jgi:hypothetical protein
MTRWIIAIAVGVLMLVEMLLNVPALFAGAFDELSPGNQKAARALFEAQRPDLPPGTKPLTLDQIAARKLGGEGWGRVFAGMKSQGLVDAKNFGQTISAYNHRHHVSSNGTVTTGANRVVGVRPQPAHRADHPRDTRARSAGAARTERGHAALASSGGGGGHRGSTAATISAQTQHGPGGGHGHGRGK